MGSQLAPSSVIDDVTVMQGISQDLEAQGKGDRMVRCAATTTQLGGLDRPLQQAGAIPWCSPLLCGAGNTLPPNCTCRVWELVERLSRNGSISPAARCSLLHLLRQVARDTAQAGGAKQLSAAGGLHSLTQVCARPAGANQSATVVGMLQDRGQCVSRQ